MQFPELDYGVPIQYTEIGNNNTIAFYEAGEGDIVLLFVHGLASYLKGWFKLIPLLSSRYRCIAIDLPGYGKSTGGVHEGTQEFYAEVLSDFILKMQLQKVVGVGHSMGGQIIFSTALLYPGLFSKLVLLAPAGLEKFTNDEVNTIKQLHATEAFIQSSDEQIQISYDLNFFKAPEDMQTMVTDRINMRGWQNMRAYAHVVTNSLFGLLDAPLFNRLPLLSTPSLVIFGENDRFIPQPILHPTMNIKEIVASAQSQNSLIASHFISECGHFIPWEKAENTAQIIRKFL